jgi:tight adherence protein B
MTPQQLIHTVLILSIFVLVFSIWTICVLLWVAQYLRRRRRLQLRLGFDDDSRRSDTLQLWRDEYRTKRPAGATPRRETLPVYLGHLFADAGWKAPVSVVLLSVLGIALLAALVVAALGMGWWLTGAAFCGVWVCFQVINRKLINDRVTRFERQFVESLGIAARALRAGHPLVGAFQSIAAEIPEPVGVIFAEICQGQALGLQLRDSLRQVADKTRNADLKLFATAVSIQMTTGGNLADVMDGLAAVVRTRTRLSRRMRVLTASTRLNRNTLLAVPICLFIFMNISSPDYIEVMYTTLAGRVMLGIGITGMLLGAWIMGRISRLKY